MKQILTEINEVPIYRNYIENLPYNPKLKSLLNGKRKAGILKSCSGNRSVQKAFIE